MSDTENNADDMYSAENNFGMDPTLFGYSDQFDPRSRELLRGSEVEFNDREQSYLRRNFRTYDPNGTQNFESSDT